MKNWVKATEYVTMKKMEKKGGLLGGKKYGADEVTAVQAAKSIIEQIPDNYIDNYQR